jgi:choline-sulfatase
LVLFLWSIVEYISTRRTGLKDILIFLSDQHSGALSSYSGDLVVRTPRLDDLAKSGTVFTNAYTACPLCIPARMSFLSGQLPSKTMVFGNAGSLASDQATFLHSLGAAGYETVLCGRMHFEGFDQRHGFSKRIFGDITPLQHGYRRNAVAERGIFGETLTESGCLEVIGGGNSPTLEYDRGVIQSALNYLKQEHGKPQCIVVGTYAPHYPYVAPPELYRYYLEKVSIPESLEGCNYFHPALAERERTDNKEIIRAIRAAYWGMVEFMDSEIGAVYDGWQSYLKAAGREGIFIYLSDHGDQAGERGFHGKETFFDCAARIPMIWNGSGIPAGKSIHSPVSIMDVGPSLCSQVHAEAPPCQDGKDLTPLLKDQNQDGGRLVISELMASVNNSYIPGRMLRWEKWKYITYHGYEKDDLLFNMEEDPCELNNVAGQNRQLLQSLSASVQDGWEPELLIQQYQIRMRHLGLQRRWIVKQELDETERWKTTPAARETPVIRYTGC